MYPEAPSPERLREYLRALAGGLCVGQDLHGWTLVHIDTDEGLGYVFEHSNDRVEFTLGPRDDRHPRYVQSRSFNLSYYAARLPGRELPRSAWELVRTLAARIITRDDGRAGMALEAPTSSHGGDIRTCKVDSLLTPVELDGARYYTANPYLGCLIGCAFCYAAPRVAMVRRLAMLDDAPWGRYVLAKANAAEVLERELVSMPRRPVVLSPLVADVYQSVERRLEITRRCLESLQRHDVPTYVLTRAALVLRDLDILAAMPQVTVGFSVPTDDDAVGRAFEPRAAAISARIDALGKLRKSGVRTVAVVQPILPMNPERLAALLADVADLVRVDVFRPADAGPVLSGPSNVHGPTQEWDTPALRDALLLALAKRGVESFRSHVPI